MERQGNQAYHKIETGEGLGVPDSTARSGDLFMSGGITYDGHISMLGITELDVGSSENSYSWAR